MTSKGLVLKTADELAIKLGFEQDCNIRIEAGLIYALEQAKNSGHCYLELEPLVKKTLNLLKLEFIQDIENSLINLENSSRVIRFKEKIYLKQIYIAEKICC